MSPLIFLDVDGPLIPFGAADGYPSRSDTGHPLLDRVDPALGPKLAGLPGELVWATTWMHDANDVVAPLLGLPALPVVTDWPEQTDEDRWEGLHWKTRALCAWAGARPFAWIDDEIGDADRRWVESRHPPRALLHRVDPHTGLTDDDFATVGAWLRG